MSALTIIEKGKIFKINTGRAFSKFSKDYMAVMAILIMMVIFTFASLYFFTSTNFTNILIQTATVGVVTIGQALYLLQQGNSIFLLVKMLA